MRPASEHRFIELPDNSLLFMTKEEALILLNNLKRVLDLGTW